MLGQKMMTQTNTAARVLTISSTHSRRCGYIIAHLVHERHNNPHFAPHDFAIVAVILCEGVVDGKIVWRKEGR